MAGATNLTIPGEPSLTRHIRETARRDALGHAVILSGQGALEEAARFLAAAMECTGENKPCGVCGPCQKVLRGIHPDVVTVTDPDHKNVAVEVLRRTVADAYILPNEGRRKVYIFPDCGLLDPKAQNVLLKVLEEGPPQAAFLFCAASSALLLPTVRSRAVQWRLLGQTQQPRSAGERLCVLLSSGSAADLASFCAELENSKITREELRGLLSDARDLLASALAACYTGAGDAVARDLAGALGRRKLSAAADVLEDLIRQCGYNVGVGHLTGALAAALTA